MALALDNAVLSQELSSTEQQLETILGTVEAGIIVRDRHGRMVYANQAAADILRLPDPEAIKSFPPGLLMDRFDVYSEHGDPIDLTDLPGSRILSGMTPRRSSFATLSRPPGRSAGCSTAPPPSSTPTAR